MGQPAISQSYYYPVEGRTIIDSHFCDGSSNHEDHDDGVIYGVHNHTLRDASSNNPKDASGWRSPSGFRHLQRNIRQITSGTTVHVHTRTPAFFTPCGLDGSDATTTVVYKGGSASDLTMTTPPGVPDSVWDKALTEALLKLQDQQVNLATNFAERKQTAELFRSSATSISTQVRNFRRVRPQDFKAAKLYQGLPGFAKRIPRAWLELQYGWKPLMSDLYGAADRINRRNSTGTADRVTVKGHATNVIETYWQKSAVNGSFLFQDRTTQKVRVSLSYSMSSPIVASLSSLGITNPAFLVWEEVPFSFVVDWFLPVGNWLNSMTADFGWNFLGGSKSLKQEFTTKAVGYKPIRDPYGLVTSNGSAADQGQEWNDYFCYTYGSSPVPGVHLKNPLSALHVSEALSLLAEAFR
jgi:hypothetical protein